MNAYPLNHVGWWVKQGRLGVIKCDSWLKERKNVIKKFYAYPNLDNFIQSKKIKAFTKKSSGKKEGNLTSFANPSIENPTLHTYIWNKIKKKIK